MCSFKGWAGEKKAAFKLMHSVKRVTYTVGKFHSEKPYEQSWDFNGNGLKIIIQTNDERAKSYGKNFRLSYAAYEDTNSFIIIFQIITHRICKAAYRVLKYLQYPAMQECLA
jgi:hypothetical protein